MHTGVPITVTSLSKTFADGTRALENVSFNVGAGEFVSILGPSGCGKSTLLKLIAGLEIPSAGKVEVSAGEHNRFTGLAYVFQDAHLLPWRSVLDNVILPLELRRMSRGEAANAARGTLAEVGLSEHVNRYPGQLSGGMKMRVSLARALITRPRLLLLDEPFGALDETLRTHLNLLLRELWAAHRMTVIFVTHSLSEAVYLSERSIVLSTCPGRVVAQVPIDLPENRPRDIRLDESFTRQLRGLAAHFEQGSGDR
jgi:NitT/TauT family transport system ATP-binding protein